MTPSILADATWYGSLALIVLRATWHWAASSWASSANEGSSNDGRISVLRCH